MSSAKDFFIKLTAIQNKALRDPIEVICGKYENNGILSKSLSYRWDGQFISVLENTKATLLITREYEHIVIALNAKDGKLRQSFIHLPHPSGIVVNRKTNNVYIAATRNPNQIIEFTPAKKLMNRAGYRGRFEGKNYLMPGRIKIYAGSYYFHDLAIINNDLYANAVGKNGIIKVNFNSPHSDRLIWSPLPTKMQNTNHIQLNSIAAGKTLSDSYFSASCEKPGIYKPGHLKFPVDGKGVIFSAKSKKVIAQNLTRPHSAKLHQKKLWVNNSGYGEFGYINNGVFFPVMKFSGWTRGLCFINNIAFVGVSKVISKFKGYAPGINSLTQKCGVYVVDLKKKEIIGSIEWPFGNQIFGIDWIDSNSTTGFLFSKSIPSSQKEKQFFFKYIV